MVILTLLSAVLVLLFWLFGWPLLALTLFLLVMVLAVAVETRKLILVTRGITYSAGADLIMAAAEYQMTQSRVRLVLGAMSSILGSAGCWPFRALIGSTGGFVLGAMNYLSEARSQGEGVGALLFFIPVPIIVLPAFALQSWFMIAGFSPETQQHWLFKTAVIAQTIALVAFLAHFHLRKRFEKNFSASSMHPLLFFLLAMVAVLAASVLTRQLLGMTFASGPREVSFAVGFQVFQAIINNSGVFDIIEAIRQAESLDALGADFLAFVQQINFARAVDMFLGISFVSTFGRSLWTMLFFSRDDDDRVQRGFAFIKLRWFEKARAECEGIGDEGKRASIACLLAVADRDVEQLVFEARRLPSSHQIRSFGDEPVVLHYFTLQSFVTGVPLSFQGLLDIVTDFAEAHGRRAVQSAVMMSYFIYSQLNVDELREVAKSSKAAETLDVFLKTLMKVPDPDADIKAVTAEAFPIDTNIAKLTVGLSSIGMSGIPQMSPEDKVIAKGNITLLLDEVIEHLSSPEGVSNIYLAIAMQSWHLSNAYLAVFGERSAQIEKVKELTEDIMRSRNFRLPDMIVRLSDAAVKF